MNTNRKAKLEKALKVKRDLFVADDSPGVRAMRVNNKLAQLHEALLAAVEALEVQSACDDDGAGGFYTDAANEALSKIDKALEEM